MIGNHGLKGNLIIYSHTRPALAVAGYRCLWSGVNAEAAVQTEPWLVERCVAHGKKILLKLAGVETPEAAEALRGQKLWVHRDEIEVGEDEFLWEDLVGMRVLTDDGRALGEVVGVQEFGAQDILFIENNEGEWMLPFIEDVILAVDEAAGCIEVQLQEGMDACFTPRS